MVAAATTTAAPWSPPMVSRPMRTFCGIDRPWGATARQAFRRPGARSRRGTIARWTAREQWLEAVSQHKERLNPSSAVARTEPPGPDGACLWPGQRPDPVGPGPMIKLKRNPGRPRHIGRSSRMERPQERPSPSGLQEGQGRRNASIPRTLKLGQGRKRRCRGTFRGGWRKLRTGLARIGVDAEQQEFRRDGAKIGRAIGQNLGRLVGFKGGVLVRQIACGRRRKDHIDRLVHLIFHWLERDYAGLSDSCAHPSSRPQAIAVAGDIDDRLKSRHLRHACECGEAGAYMFVGDKVEMQPRFRDILKPNRALPWLAPANHETSDLALRTGRHQPDWRMATESENASCPRRRHDGAMETVSNVAP